MRTGPMDRMVIKGQRIGESDRNCEILEVRREGGGAPYVVRWGDTGYMGPFFPGSDAQLHHFERAAD